MVTTNNSARKEEQIVTLYSGKGGQAIVSLVSLQSSVAEDSERSAQSILMTILQKALNHRGEQVSWNVLVCTLEVQTNQLKYLFQIPAVVSEKNQTPMIVRQSQSQADRGKFEILANLAFGEVLYLRTERTHKWYRSLKKDSRVLRKIQSDPNSFVSINLDTHVEDSAQLASRFVVMNRAPGSSVCQFEIYRSEEKKFFESDEFSRLNWFKAEVLDTSAKKNLVIAGRHQRVFLDSVLTIVGVTFLLNTGSQIASKSFLSIIYFSYPQQQTAVPDSPQLCAGRPLFTHLQPVPNPAEELFGMNTESLQSVETSFRDPHTHDYYYLQVYCVINTLMLGFLVFRKRSGRDTVDTFHRSVDDLKNPDKYRSFVIRAIDKRLTIEQGSESGPVGRCLVLFGSGETAQLDINLNQAFLNNSDDG